MIVMVQVLWTAALVLSYIVSSWGKPVRLVWFDLVADTAYYLEDRTGYLVSFCGPIARGVAGGT